MSYAILILVMVDEDVAVMEILDVAVMEILAVAVMEDLTIDVDTIHLNIVGPMEPALTLELIAHLLLKATNPKRHSRTKWEEALPTVEIATDEVG